MKLRYELRTEHDGDWAFDTKNNRLIASYPDRDSAVRGVKEYNDTWIGDLGYEDGKDNAPMNAQFTNHLNYLDGYEFGQADWYDAMSDRLAELCESDPDFNDDCDSCGDALWENVTTWGIGEIVAIVETYGFGSDWHCKCDSQ